MSEHEHEWRLYGDRTLLGCLNCDVDQWVDMAEVDRRYRAHDALVEALEAVPVAQIVEWGRTGDLCDALHQWTYQRAMALRQAKGEERKS